MTKSQLIERLTEKMPHINKKDAMILVNLVVDSMCEGLKKEGRVEIRGFGSFQVRVRRAREGRNPKTGQLVHISEKKVPFFKVGKELRDRLNLPAGAPPPPAAPPPSSEPGTGTPPASA